MFAFYASREICELQALETCWISVCTVCTFLKNVLQDMLDIDLSSLLPFFYYLKSKAALCFFCLLTNIEPSHKYQPQSRVQLVGLWLWDCLWAVRWSSAGQTSQIYHKYSDFYFFTAPWISDNGSDWICTDRKEVVKKSYWESKLKQMKIYCISVFFALCHWDGWIFVFLCVDRAMNTFLLLFLLRHGRLGSLFFLFCCHGVFWKHKRVHSLLLEQKAKIKCCLVFSWQQNTLVLRVRRHWNIQQKLIKQSNDNLNKDV